MNIGLYQSAAAMSALERWQDVVSQNITSAQTTGYRARAVEFSSHSSGKWLINPQTKNSDPDNEHDALFTQVTSSINFQNGETQPTRRELDVAIQGEGFLEMQGPDDRIFYTRNGELRMTPDRTLVGAGSMKILNTNGDPIVLLPNGGAVTINRDGSVYQGSNPLGKIAVYSFENLGALMPQGSGLFVAPEGVEKQKLDKPELMQGYLENSNVQPLREMVDLVLISRAYEANQKIISTVDQQLEKTLQALG